MAGFSYFDATHWKYVNSGTADLLSSSGTTLTDLPASQSKTGSAFYQTTRAKCFDIPATKEIWLKFDVYFNGANRWRAYNEGSAGFCGVTAQTTGYIYIFSNENELKGIANTAVKNQLQSVLLHMSSDNSAGIIEAWVDGKKIYSYTGNVNNGDDFADIYLQSDGAGTYFSNVLISNFQSPPIARQVNIKPAIFASALIDLPTAEIDIKPEIFVVVATKKPPVEIYILPEIYVTIKEDAPTAEIDILPEIWATIYSPPQFVRITGDTARIVKKSDSASGDTLREISKSEIIRGDTLRQLVDPSRVFETATADLLCRLATTERVTADTKLNLATSEIVTADTLRKIQRTEIARADTCRALREFARADTLRIICRAESVKADTIIRRPHILRYTVESPTRRLLKAAPNQSLVNSFKDYGVTAFNITLNERTLSDTFNLEIARQMNINDAAQGQLLDYHFSFLVEETSQQGLIQSVKGMYDIDKLLYSHIDSSGTIRYRDGDTEEMTAAITTGYIVYKKDEGATVFCARASDIINRTADYLCLTPNIKIQDFTPYNLSGNTNITYADLISTLFSWTSRLPQRQINVFIRGNVLHCIQRGLEDSAFDISNLKHSRPTVTRKLLRTMYNSPFASYKLKDKDKPDAPDIPDDYSEPEIAVPFSGTISFSNDSSSISYRYLNGLLVKETHRLSNSTCDAHSESEYLYAEVFPEGISELSIWLHNLTGDFYLSAKATNSTTIQYGDSDSDTKKISAHSSTDYRYSRTNSGDVYLVEEFEQSSQFEYEHGTKIVYDYENMQNQAVGVWTLVDSDSSVRRTFHAPVGNGWYGTSVYLNGEPQGSTLSQGKPGNKVSPYTINQVQKTFTGNVTITYDGDDASGSGGDSGDNQSAEDEYNERRRRLSPIADTSFPVRELSLIRVLTNALYWLNRKTQETVSVEVTDEIKNGVPTNNHIIDFTERVILDGKEYFLVSNQVSFTPRSFIQKLQLVRWF